MTNFGPILFLVLYPMFVNIYLYIYIYIHILGCIWYSIDLGAYCSWVRGGGLFTSAHFTPININDVQYNWCININDVRGQAIAISTGPERSSKIWWICKMVWWVFKNIPPLNFATFTYQNLDNRKHSYIYIYLYSLFNPNII